MLTALVPAVTGDINDATAALFNGTTGFFGLVFYVITVVALWKVFVKAGEPGFLAIIPIVNVVYVVKIAGKSPWLALLYLIPIVGVVFAIIVALNLGRRFGKGGVFSFFLLWLIPFVGYLILGFGSATYTKQA